MWRIMAIVLAVLFAGVANSSEKPNLKTTEPKSSAETEQRGSDKNPFTVKVLPSPDADTKATQEEKYRYEKSAQDEKLVDATIWLVRITGILALCTGGLWWATYRLARDAKRTATQQATDMRTSLAIAKTSADAALKTAKNMETADRAYMKMTHELPGIMFNETKSLFQVTLRIENCGKTPASVSDVRLGVTILEHGEPLPRFPLYSDPPFDETHYGFLVPNDFFFHKRHFPTGTAIEEVRVSAKKLWIHAYVDYRDTFGQRYRAGYARTYEPVIDNGERDNLLFVIEGYNNYDRQRQPDEGNDWNDPR